MILSVVIGGTKVSNILSTSLDLFARRIFGILGYEARRKPKKESIQSEGVLVYSYLKPDGSFDYEQYKKIQTSGNKLKINSVWAQEENIKFVSQYIKNYTNPEFGICHGTRRGKEQEWFNKYLDCKVIGTEISDTATQFPNTIQWDFHEVKPEWVGNVDFIYSNSFDHSFDPEKCINAWMNCIKPGGFCFLEHASNSYGSNELDPFGADLWIIPYLILKWGNGKFAVKEILDPPTKPAGAEGIRILVIQNNN